MKALFFVLALTFVCSLAAVPGGSTQQDVDKLMAFDPSIKELLNFATEQFVQQASQSNAITGTQFTVQKVNSVSTQVVAGMNIKYNVDLVNAEGQVYNVDLTVFSQPWTNTKRLTSFHINN